MKKLILFIILCFAFKLSSNDNQIIDAIDKADQSLIKAVLQGKKITEIEKYYYLLHAQKIVRGKINKLHSRFDRYDIFNSFLGVGIYTSILADMIYNKDIPWDKLSASIDITSGIIGTYFLYKGLTKNKRSNDLKKAEAVVKIIEQIKIDEKK